MDSGDPEDFEDTVRGAACRALERGPVPLPHLARRLRQSGHLWHLEDLDEEEVLEELDQILLETDDTWMSEDGLVALTAQLLDGAVFIHRLTEAEAAVGMAAVSPDLDVIDFGLDEGLDWAGGGRVACRYPFEGETRAEPNGSLVGPPGWLAAFQAGDLLAFTRRGRVLEVRAVESLSSGDHEAAALEAAFRGRHRPGTGQEPTEIVLDALCRQPGLFRVPVPPVGELLEQVGLERRGPRFGLADEEWMQPGVGRLDAGSERRAAESGLEACCTAAFDLVRDAWASSLGPTQVDAPPLREVAGALAHGSVAPAFAEHVLGEHAHGSPALEAFATEVAGLPGPSGACGLFLRALGFERDGRTLEAEADLHDAVRRDPSFRPALAELAWYAADRGDAARAASLLQRAGVPADDPELEYLTIRVPRVARVGRNERCPCGSGRKFKACCDRDPKVPIERRAGWVVHKLASFALRPHRRGRLVELADIATGPGHPDAFVAMLSAPFLSDLVVFEGGAAAEFLDERGELLPPDERRLVEDWLGTGRRLWEITSVDPGRSLTLRDSGTGDSIVVAERTASTSHGPGEMVLARVVPVGAQHQLVGQALVVELRHRESLLRVLDADPGAEDFAAWFGQLSAPPRLQNREGGDTVMCRAVLRPTTTAWSDLAPLLEGRFEADGKGMWVDTTVLDDGDTVIRGHLRREEDDLVVETNSIERLERLLDVIGGLAADLEVVEDERRKLADVMAEADEVPRRGFPSGVTPEVRAGLESFIADREDRWVDEPVPALAGLSPRRAADDPTRREDLMALLREFERHAPPPGATFATFDPARLREKLGLAD